MILSACLRYNFNKYIVSKHVILLFCRQIHKKPNFDRITDISEFHVEPLTKSKFIVPYRLAFVQDGVKRKWDGIRGHDSVSVLIYHKELKSFIFVKQFRPVVYYKKLRDSLGVDATTLTSTSGAPLASEGGSVGLTGTAGLTIELCAGIIDKQGKSPEEVAVEEIFEECGYRVHPGDLQKITKTQNVDSTGSESTTYYVAISAEQRVVGDIRRSEMEEGFIDTFIWPIRKGLEVLHWGESGVSVSAPLILSVLWFQSEILPVLKDA